MAFFNNTPQVEKRIPTLISRMMILQQAIENKEISLEEIAIISKLSTVDLGKVSQDLIDNKLDASKTPNTELKKLYDILKKAGELTVIESTHLVDGLKRFDSEHGDYLPLAPLASLNDQSLSLCLNDFATFYAVFARHMNFKKETGDFGDVYSFNFDLLAARNDWLGWQRIRPVRINFDRSQIDLSGVFEKFLAGKLQKNEWLTDLDIQRELKILGLQQTHIVPFTDDNIGLVLHFEREKHQLDEPKVPYVIPLIVNLGEDGFSRLDSRGVHWTRMLVTVDPRNAPPTITVDYNDDLYLHENSKKNIETTLRKALKYQTQLGGYTKGEPLKIYKAFPDCDAPTINITGSGQQKDGFTCGYRALKGILNDLIQKGIVQTNAEYQKFLDCDDSTSLRDYVYRSLLGNQRITTVIKSTIEHALPNLFVEDVGDKEHFFVKPDLVEGQLLAFAHPAVVKKDGKKGQFDGTLLENLVKMDKKMGALRDLKVIKDMATLTKQPLGLNLQEILDEVTKVETDPALILHVIFEQIAKNSALKKIRLLGTNKIDMQILHEKIEVFPLDVEFTADDKDLSNYLTIISARNALLKFRQIKVLKGGDPWDSLFENMLFMPAYKPTSTRFEWTNQNHQEGIKSALAMGVSGFTKLLRYMSAHEDRFVATEFPYKEFRISANDVDKSLYKMLEEVGLGMLTALKAHLQSKEPFIPFKQFHFFMPAAIKEDELIKELSDILAAMKPPGLEKIEIESDSFAKFDIKTIQKLIDVLKEKNYPTVLAFSTIRAKVNPDLLLKFQELENIGLTNQRKVLTQTVAPSDQSRTPRKEPVVLGKIGKAILKMESLGGLSTEVQIQEQQQQQVQQQIQSALDDEELPEESEVPKEAFPPYNSEEELITRDTSLKLFQYIIERHPHIDDSGICWDLITGKNAALFNYGIKKMTISAAKVLIDHLQDVQYGLHPDNLPRGFALQQDKDGGLVLSYSPFNPPINPNESPLTVRFSKALAPNKWHGNALQFLSREQANNLYKAVIGPMKEPRPTLEECINHCFFLNTNKMTNLQAVSILNAFIDAVADKDASNIQKQIREIFGDKPSLTNVKALSEVLYEKGPQGLSSLLDTLSTIKKTKGEKFFASFKTCFIDPSNNLNELTTKSAQTAMQKLLTMSKVQTAWWISLTEQHTSNYYYNPPKSSKKFTVVPGQRWANLAELTEGFFYFCGQLEEVSPGLKLSEFCPLTGIGDMRVALDRLLTTILPNAHKVDEQFYEGLGGLSLDALGPFYASRYEGYKLVTPDMMLNLSDSYISKDAAKNKKYAVNDFCFKVDKNNIGSNMFNVSTNTNDKKRSLFMRYIASANHRTTYSQYIQAFNKVVTMKLNNESFGNTKENLLILIARFGTGKRGKHFTQEHIDALINWSFKYDNDPVSNENKAVINILDAWVAIKSPIQPTLNEILEISKLIFPTGSPAKFISNTSDLLARYKEDAEGYIEALLLLAKNKHKLTADLFQNTLHQIEGLDVKPFKAEFPFDPPKISVAAAKLLAVCKSDGVDQTNALAKARALYTEINKCLKTHGPQTTSDLLELLGHIDLDISTDLPTLDALTQLVKTVAEGVKPNYSDLEGTVKKALPKNCIIQMEKVIATSVEPPGNLNTTITKYMSEIIKELESKKELIDKQLGKGFFDSLSTPEGPRKLLDNLEGIAKESSFMSGLVKGKIQGVMLKVYDSVTKDGLEHIGIKDGETNKLLAKIVNNKLPHPIKEEKDFDSFIKHYAGELQSLNQILGNLQSINKNWPFNFKGVLAILDNSTYLKAYPLSILADITGALVTNLNKNVPFPVDLMRKFLEFEKITKESCDALKGILDTVFDQQLKDVSDTEKRLLCELGLRYCQDNAEKPQAVKDYLNKLLALRKSDDSFFSDKLKFLSRCDKVDDKTLSSIQDAFQIISQLKNKTLIATAWDYFTKDENRANEFISIIFEISKIKDAQQQSMVLTIALKTAQLDSAKQHQDKQLLEVITALNQLDAKVLVQLDALYRSPKYPKLSSLHPLLTDKAKVLDEKCVQDLQAEYDRDYWLKKEKFDRNFNTKQLPKYLDNLQDMNYERPLLLSQRAELQRWYLYVNSIGDQRGVPTTPWTDDGGAFKSFKQMSHKEMQDLLKYYRDQLKDKKLAPEQRTKLRLETIALLREAMYRGTGKFPRPTQILYLLAAMQSGKDFIAQIQTGQGKSLTAGLAAALANVEGKTVDICTSSLFLASDGLKENQGFFEYLDITAKLIHANSAKEEYEEGAIHYSSMSELALHRSKMQLLGKVFPQNCTLIADEVDFSTLDDSTRYRYATSLDPVTDPYKSPYTWIYEALVPFVDSQKEQKSDEEFLKAAKSWLADSAKTSEEKAQLKALEDQPEVYKKRLETWLVAAGKTNQLVELEQVRFRVVTLDHPKYSKVSKACILTGGRPNIQAEFSDTVQQFLHVRLRQKYSSEIEKGTMPDFLVEPEKTYITTMNSKILLNTYKQRMGMTGTAGSKAEIREQYAKYGFRFVDIPPYTESKRQDLKPILTNPKLVTKPDEEERDHISKIVHETLHYLRQQQEGMAGPILIHCADKEQGEKIYQALQDAININLQKYQTKFQGVNKGIQRFYSSEKPTPDERNAEENTVKENAALDGMITISTVFGRGTDIKTKNKKNGLYTIDTFVDTDRYSSEDLERSKQQKIGRSGRDGQVGATRLIVRRSEFADVYSTQQMQKIPDTAEGLNESISKLNHKRNKKRVTERELRESFDDMKELIYQEFFKYIQVINRCDEKGSKKAIRDKVTKQWNLVLSRIDTHWEELQHNPNFKELVPRLKEMTQFACEQWNAFAKADGILRKNLKDWASYNKVKLTLPEENPLNHKDVLGTISARKPLLERFYVKKMQQYRSVDPEMHEAAVYSDFMSSSKQCVEKVNEAKNEAIDKYISTQLDWLINHAHNSKLITKFTLNSKDPSPKKVEQIVGALLYLRYKAYRDGNSLEYAHLSHQCHRFENQILWSKDEKLINAVVGAQQTHFKTLTAHRGNHEDRKGRYLNIIMPEGRKQFAEKTKEWKKDNFETWWNGGVKGPSGMKTQAEEWLSAYRDDWWTRGWVSTDRKEVVTELLKALKLAKDPKEILGYIATARVKLLGDDKKNSRSLKSGVQGRLYQYLNELELKLQSAMRSDALDACTDIKLDNIKVALQQALDVGIKSKELRKVVATLNNAKATPQEKYKALSVFFYNISSMDKPTGSDDTNWIALRDYCQQTQLQLVDYFAQCDANSSFNKQRSIQVYQVASEAAAAHFSAHFKDVMYGDESPKLNLPSTGFNYRDQRIKFILKNPCLINEGLQFPLFNKVNQDSTYSELLHSLEKSIVEHSDLDTQVHFKSITLDVSDYYANEVGFKLTVDMIIDGIPAQVDYHINMETGKMYCNDQYLQKLNEPHPQEPELGAFSLDKELSVLERDLAQIQGSSKHLMEQTEKLKRSLNALKSDPLIKGSMYAHRVTHLTQSIEKNEETLSQPKDKKSG